MSIVLTFIFNRLLRLWAWFASDKEVLKKTARHIKDEYKEGYQKEGDTHISKKTPQKPHIKGGEYVDYEEVK